MNFNQSSCDYESAQRDWNYCLHSTMSSPPIHPTTKRIKTSAPVHPPAQLLAQQPLQPIHPFHPQVSPFEGIHMPQPQISPSNPRKRRASPPSTTATNMAPPPMPTTAPGDLVPDHGGGAPEVTPRKKGRTNTPWSAEEEQRLKTMRDAGSSWSEIAKTFPTRTEGSVKKHWYKDMHYAEFAEDETIALRDAIKEYESNKWKVIGQKVGKPAKACEQYAKEHFKDL